MHHVPSVSTLGERALNHPKLWYEVVENQHVDPGNSTDVLSKNKCSEPLRYLSSLFLTFLEYQLLWSGIPLCYPAFKVFFSIV